MSRETDLIAQLAQASHDYYVRNQPTLTDLEFDALLRELQGLEREAGRALPGSPTQRVGSDLVGGFVKVPHLSPMLSLDNTFNVEQVQRHFMAENSPSTEIVIEGKIDGASLELRYEKGLLVQAITRGDGTTGDDVTANVRAIRAIPLQLAEPLTLRVRGEIFMRRSVFDALNVERVAAGEEPFANPRNAASGSLKQKSPSEVSRRKLSFFAYWSNLPETFGQIQMVQKLSDLGLPTLYDAPLAVSDEKASDSARTCALSAASMLGSATALSSLLDWLQEIRGELDFDLDGAVIKINDRQKQAELGNKTKSPVWACAFKFPAERVATLLEGIEITVGRTGQITPNARLKPVSLAGTTVSNASLMNADEIARIGNPAPGDIVWVEKSAEIIPRVVGVKTKGGQTWAFPGGCICGIELERRGVHYFCNNPACEEKVFQQMKHALAKPALDWDGMGEAQVRLLIRSGQELRERALKLSDLFTLDPQALGFKPAAVKKFLVERERVKTAPLWRKLCALGIESIGQTASKELASTYGSLDKIIDALLADADGQPSEIRSLLGPVALKSLALFLQAEVAELEALESLGFVFADPEKKVGPMTGKILVITGTLTSGTRDQVVARIEAAGGLVKNSVGKKTSYLVTGEQPGGTKTTDAQKHGVPVLTEEQLYGLLGEPMPAGPVLADLEAI
jgi:DNA ligase (NAD+)